MAYSEILQKHGIGWTPTFITCDRIFRFGNDQTETCSTACVVPVNFAGQTGHIYVYVLPGHTPFLFPRPLMEKFGMIVDFGRKRLMWKNSLWTDVRQTSPNGHYLLNLMDNWKQLRSKLRRPDFSHYPSGVAHSILTIGFGDQIPAMIDDDDDEDTESLSKGLTPKISRQLTASVNQKASSLKKILAEAKKPVQYDRRIWLVYCNYRCIAKRLWSHYHIEAELFCLDTEWDLTDSQHQSAFWRKWTDANLMSYG